MTDDPRALSLARASVCATEALAALRACGLDVPASVDSATLDATHAAVAVAVAGAVTDADVEEEHARRTSHGDDARMLAARCELLRSAHALWRRACRVLRRCGDGAAGDATEAT